MEEDTRNLFHPQLGTWAGIGQYADLVFPWPLGWLMNQLRPKYVFFLLSYDMFNHLEVIDRPLASSHQAAGTVSRRTETYTVPFIGVGYIAPTPPRSLSHPTLCRQNSSKHSILTNPAPLGGASTGFCPYFFPPRIIFFHPTCLWNRHCPTETCFTNQNALTLIINTFHS